MLKDETEMNCINYGSKQTQEQSTVGEKGISWRDKSMRG